MIKTKEPQYPKRVRNELRFRELTVLRVERVGAAFQRIVLGGEALEGFVSQGFDDHTKLFFPQAGTAFTPPQVTEEGINWGEGVRPATRDYTPLYDAERHELAYDFFIHDGGIASSWALAANVGDKLVIGGPRVRWWCQRIMPGSCMSAMNPVCLLCAAVCWALAACPCARRLRRW